MQTMLMIININSYQQIQICCHHIPPSHLETGKCLQRVSELFVDLCSKFDILHELCAECYLPKKYAYLA